MLTAVETVDLEWTTDEIVGAIATLLVWYEEKHKAPWRNKRSAEMLALTFRAALGGDYEFSDAMQRMRAVKSELHNRIYRDRPDDADMAPTDAEIGAQIATLIMRWEHLHKPRGRKLRGARAIASCLHTALNLERSFEWCLQRVGEGQ